MELNSISNIELHTTFIGCILKVCAFMVMHFYPNLTNALGILPQSFTGIDLISTFIYVILSRVFSSYVLRSIQSIDLIKRFYHLNLVLLQESCLYSVIIACSIIHDLLYYPLNLFLMTSSHLDHVINRDLQVLIITSYHCSNDSNVLIAAILSQ